MRRLTILALAVAAPALAQPAGAPIDHARLTAPFIDEHTLVVVRVDVTRVHLDTLLKLLTVVMGDNEETGEAAKEIRLWVKEFTRRATDVYLTYGPGDYPNMPCLFAKSPADGAARADLARLLMAPYKKASVDVSAVDLHGCVCAGTPEALAVLKARKAVDRPELSAALAAGKEGTAQLAFALSAEAKKIHEQVAPTLPAELGGGGIQKITRGLKWASLSVGAGPKMPATLIVEATSPQAARDLKGLDIMAQQMLLGQFLRGAGESDADTEKRLKALLDRHSSSMEGSRMTTEWDLATVLLDAVKVPDGVPADRLRSANNLKQLMLAMHNYHDVVGRFPADVRAKDGTPLLSWRVLILPYIEQEQLYKQFRLNEPWDSAHNKKLIAQMPKTLRSPRQAAASKDRTTYLAPLGKGFIWDDPKGIVFPQISDGSSNTIALVEADDERAVIWTKPEDISIDAKNPVNGLLGHYGDGFQAALADGSVRYFKKSTDPKVLWALFTRAGGEVVNPDK